MPIGPGNAAHGVVREVPVLAALGVPTTAHPAGWVSARTPPVVTCISSSGPCFRSTALDYWNLPVADVSILAGHASHHHGAVHRSARRHVAARIRTHRQHTVELIPAIARPPGAPSLRWAPPPLLHRLQTSVRLAGGPMRLAGTSGSVRPFPASQARSLESVPARVKAETMFR